MRGREISLTAKYQCKNLAGNASFLTLVLIKILYKIDKYIFSEYLISILNTMASINVC